MRKTFIGIGYFIQTPAGVVVITTIIWLGILWGLNIPFNPYVSIVIFFADIGIALFLLDRLLYFFSQFLFPVQNQKDRREIYLRVRNFESGDRGPTLFIKNGRVIEHEGEAGKHGPGILVLDTASAAVLRTDTKISSTVGPGVKFTQPDEYIAGSVDLRSQWQFIGPLESGQPFFNPASKASSKSSELQSYSLHTNGLTRDGFEISPTISIKFNIKRPVEDKPTESGVTSRYGFDPTSVHNAITREIVRLSRSDKNKSRMEWNKLPAHLVVNLWREYIRKFKLEELFTTKEISGLQTIEDMINKRVCQSRVVALNDSGLPTGERLESLEYKQLQLRGLEIREVRIHNVLFDPSIEEQTIQQWSAEWMNMARQEASILKEKEALIETAARDEAVRNFARIASSRFGGKLSLSGLNPFKTLQLLVQPLKDFIVTKSKADSEMESELRKLDEIWKWLLDHDAESALEPDEVG